MILETIVSTLDVEGRPNFAPMGIVLEGESVLLRPYKTAVTWRNLQDVGEGVVNFTDNVLLFARCAVESCQPPHREAQRVRGKVLEDACTWMEFVVESKDLTEERGLFRGRVVGTGRLRDFIGFNRARHAVIEATILITRIHLLGRDRVVEAMTRLRPLIDKTAGKAEREAFEFLEGHAGRWTDGR